MKRLALTKKIQALMMASTLALGAFVMPGTLPAATEAVESFNAVTITGNTHMTVNEVQQLKANTSVTWRSGNTAVAKVDSNGYVTAIASGKATITATAGQEKSSITITVGAIEVTGIDITMETTEMTQGGAQQLMAKVYPEDASNRGITWRISSPSVATISKTGFLTAKAPGVFTVYATSQDGTKVEATSEEITVYPKTTKVKKAQNLGNRQVMASWTQVSGATGYQLQYSSDPDFDESVKTKNVKNGKTVSATVGFKKKGKRYFRVRAYKTVEGEKIYGEWGDVKSIKVP